LPVSIIISSYNYGRFVGEAIESALAQTYSPIEIIVVDDGSADESRSVIRRYSDRVWTIFKNNGGQASALNAGFAASRGDLVVFLDSDDTLLPGAIARAVPLLDAGVSKVHWPLWEVGERGARSGEVMPRDALSEGDLRPALLRAGADGYTWPPTSGNAWSRQFLERVLPMPEEEYRTCPDYYLATLAPLFGTVRRITDPQGTWRNHGGNQSWAQPIGPRLETMLQRLDHSLASLALRCQTLGIDLDVAQCKANSWWQWLARTWRAIQEIEGAVPAGAELILVDEDTWDPREVSITGRRVIPFLEKDGSYWGPPPDDITAVQELERLRRAGASFIAFAWPAFWWLEYYRALQRHLETTFRQVLRNERLIVYDLRVG
jgi:glycosyltransferase involved in cell wall biosynthesis